MYHCRYWNRLCHVTFHSVYLQLSASSTIEDVKKSFRKISMYISFTQHHKRARFSLLWDCYTPCPNRQEATYVFVYLRNRVIWSRGQLVTGDQMDSGSVDHRWPIDQVIWQLWACRLQFPVGTWIVSFSWPNSKHAVRFISQTVTSEKCDSSLHSSLKVAECNECSLQHKVK